MLIIYPVFSPVLRNAWSWSLLTATQVTFNCSNSTIETVQKDMKHVQS